MALPRGQHHGPGAVGLVGAGLHVDAEGSGDPAVLPQELRDHGPLAHLDFPVEDLLAERAQHPDAAAHRRTTARVGAPQAFLLVELLAVGGLLEVQPHLFQLDDPVGDLVDDGSDDLLVGDEVAADDGVPEVHLLAVPGVGVAEGRLGHSAGGRAGAASPRAAPCPPTPRPCCAWTLPAPPLQAASPPPMMRTSQSVV